MVKGLSWSRFIETAPDAVVKAIAESGPTPQRVDSAMLDAVAVRFAAGSREAKFIGKLRLTFGASQASNAGVQAGLAGAKASSALASVQSLIAAYQEVQSKTAASETQSQTKKVAYG
jgi:hypothetical protein